MIVKSNRVWANGRNKSPVKPAISVPEPKKEEVKEEEKIEFLPIEEEIFEDIDDEEDLSEDGGVG